MKYLLLLISLIFTQNLWAISVDDHQAIYVSYLSEGQGKIADAIGKLTSIYQKNPNDYFVNYRLGWLFSLEKKYKNSVDHYKKAADLSPASIEPWLALSSLSINLADWTQARKYAEEILERTPTNYYGQLRYIQAQIQLKEFDKALTKAEAALKLYPTDKIFLEQKAFSLAKLNRVEAAKMAILDLLLVDPQNIYAKSFMSTRTR